MDPHAPRARDEQYADLEKNADSSDRLSVFREQVGITAVPELGARTLKRKAPNIGIYNRVATEEREAKYQYIFSALLINTCLLAQVVFASALTALGAGNGSHTQITILGAANTVIAAVLTFTKGQGLPNRLRQYQCSLRKIREHIEQRERDFAQLDCKLDVNVEVHKIIDMYEEVRQTDENNDPSTYHASTASPAKEPIVPSEKPQDIVSPRIRFDTSPVAKRISPTEGSKEDLKIASPGNENAPSPTTPIEDSRKWKIAYSVADRLLSDRPTSLVEDRALIAEDSSDQPEERVDTKKSNASKPKNETETSREEEGLTKTQPRRTHADRPAVRSEDSERFKIANSVADRWYQANLGGTFEGVDYTQPKYQFNEDYRESRGGDDDDDDVESTSSPSRKASTPSRKSNGPSRKSSAPSTGNPPSGPSQQRTNSPSASPPSRPAPSNADRSVQLRALQRVGHMMTPEARVRYARIAGIPDDELREMFSDIPPPPAGSPRVSPPVPPPPPINGHESSEGKGKGKGKAKSKDPTPPPGPSTTGRGNTRSKSKSKTPTPPPPITNTHGNPNASASRPRPRRPRRTRAQMNRVRTPPPPDAPSRNTRRGHLRRRGPAATTGTRFGYDDLEAAEREGRRRRRVERERREREREMARREEMRREVERRLRERILREMEEEDGSE